MGLSYSASWVSVCNQALGRLGKGNIADLDEGSQLANYCSLFLGQAVEEVLGIHDWSAPRTRAQLAQLVETPAYGPAYYYQLPSDFIRLIDISADEEEWAVEGDRIATDAEEVYITYLHRPTGPNSLTSAQRKAVSTRLAFLLSTPLTSSEGLAQRVMQEDQAALNDAIASDGRRAMDDEPGDWYGDSR